LVESREYRVEVWMTLDTKISKPFIVLILFLEVQLK
jgi:hypothetical protein